MGFRRMIIRLRSRDGLERIQVGSEGAVDRTKHDKTVMAIHSFSVGASTVVCVLTLACCHKGKVSYARASAIDVSKVGATQMQGRSCLCF